MSKRKVGMPPTHNLRILNKETDERATVGMGWENGDGSVTIKLNAMAVLSEADLRDFHIRLFPSDWEVSTERTLTKPEAEPPLPEDEKKF